MPRHLSLGFLLLLSAASAGAFAQSTDGKDWLSGTWVMCEDPDGHAMHSLQFNADGTGSIVSADGTTPFLHKHSRQWVSMLVNPGGIVLPPSTLTVSQDMDKLFLKSETTGHSLFYVRAEKAKAFKCSAK